MSAIPPFGVVVLSAVRHAGSYLPVLQAIPGVRVISICEETDAPDWAHQDAAALGKQYDVPVADNVQETLDRPEVDLVLVCSEPVRHARLAMQALAAGKHVITDKPFATTLADASALRRATRTASGSLTMIHRLFSPPIQRARAAIDAGHVGLPRSVDLEWLASDGLSGETVERADLVADPALSGGGEIMNFLTYPISTIRYLTGAEIRSVYAEAGTFFFDPHRQHGVEDAAMLSLELDHGILATITVGRVPQAPAPGAVSANLRLIGSHGHLTLDESQPVLDAWRPKERRGLPIGGDSGQEAVRAVIHHAIDDLRAQRQPLFTAADGWATIAAIDAAYRSVTVGQPVDVQSHPEATRDHHV